MKEDSTFLLSESIGWVVDWEHPRLEMCRDSRTGGTYGKVTYTVTKDPGHDWKAGLGDGQWYKHSNEVTVLKHMSAGVTMVCLEVHYESYVNRHGRKRRTDVMPFRNGQRLYEPLPAEHRLLHVRLWDDALALRIDMPYDTCDREGCGQGQTVLPRWRVPHRAWPQVLHNRDRRRHRRAPISREGEEEGAAAALLPVGRR